MADTTQCLSKATQPEKWEFCLSATCLLVIVGLALSASQKVARADACGAMAELIEFVAAETGHRPLAHCPPVETTSQAELKSLFATASAHGEEPLAAYLPGSGNILLSSEIDLTTALGQSYLVHELVHASQAARHQHASCLGSLEAEAYWVQASYLRRHGQHEAAKPFALLSVMFSMCPQPYGR